MPVYSLLGGPCRAAVPCYAHASGRTLTELEDDVRRYLEEGWQYVRCQLGAYGGGGFREGDERRLPARTPAPEQRRAFDDETYVEIGDGMFAYLRDKLGFGPKLTHDVHEHLRPNKAVALAKLLEPYRLFFLEDVLPPEQIAYYRQIRQQCTTPQAMGELFINVQEWLPLISERLIDFIRVRVSKVGGITPAQKIAHLCEWFGVHTAWQEGGNTDPVNQTAAMHLDLASWNFGIQEENGFRAGGAGGLPRPPGAGARLPLPQRPARAWASTSTRRRRRSLLDPERAARPRYVAEDRRADGSVVSPEFAAPPPPAALRGAPPAAAFLPTSYRGLSPS